MKNIYETDVFSAKLFEKMKPISPTLGDLELYEFRYALKNITPAAGWNSVQLDTKEEIESRVNNRAFYDSIQIKSSVDGRIILDEKIVHLANMLFVGLVIGVYEEFWINKHFYFDVRGFFFLHRTSYFTGKVLAHLGDKPLNNSNRNKKRLSLYRMLVIKSFEKPMRKWTDF